MCPPNSIFDNTIYESHNLNNIYDAIYLLPDNTQKLISPKDVRDNIYTVWESIVFKKIQHPSSLYYIGVDDDDLKCKMYFGKKKNGNTYVLNSVLLNYSINDTDIFIFNNKPGLTPNNTKLSILAGTNSYLYGVAPYINAYVSQNTKINLEIINITGDIIINSNNGNVIINNLKFPTVAENMNATNNMVLKYNNGKLIWDELTYNMSVIGNTSSPTYINGSPVLINGYDIEFNDSRPLISTFGHIYSGMTFQNAPIVNVIREMLYPYLPPVPEIKVNVGYGFTTHAVAEKNSPITATISWSLLKRSDPVINSNITNVLSYTPLNINAPGSIYLSSPPFYTGVTTSSGFLIDYVFSVTDTGDSNYMLSPSMTPIGPTSPQTYHSIAVLELVYPIFYGVVNYNINMNSPINSDTIDNSNLNNHVIPNLNKVIKPTNIEDLTINLNGYGYIYILYPVNYGNWQYGSPLNSIKDENDYEMISSFTHSVFTNVSSPQYYWNNIQYNVYKFNHPVLIGSSNPVEWKIKFTI